MKYILLLMMLSFLHIEAYNLEDIRDAFKTSAKVRAVIDAKESKLAQNSLLNSYSSPVVGATLSYADERLEDGLEYSVGISQQLNNPLSTLDKKSAIGSLNTAFTLESRHDIHIMELELVSKYYGTCNSKEILKNAKDIYSKQSKSYAHVKRAYELGEISKKELLFSKLELAKVRQSLNHYRVEYIEEFSELDRSVDNLSIDSISCDDLHLPSRQIIRMNMVEHNELKVLAHKKDASKALYKIHDSSLQSLSYELLYEQELETKRYTFGLRLPISGATSRQELQRAQELALSSSLSFEHESMRKGLEESSSAFILKLELIYDDLKLLEEEILPLNQELLELTKSAYAEGEGSVLEYLDASRSNSENILTMLELKKTYYYELFEFYKIADIEYGEEQ